MAASLRSLLRSAASTVVQLGEDPETLVEHLFQDLGEMIPTLDQQQRTSATAIRLLERQLQDLAAQEEKLLPLASAALATESSEGLGLGLVAALEALRGARTASVAELAVLQEAHRHSLEAKRRILSGLQDRCREVAGFLPASEEAEWRVRVHETVLRLSRNLEDSEAEKHLTELHAQARTKVESKPLPEVEPASSDELEAATQRLRDLPLAARLRGGPTQS